jgi:5'(3')-deoxyribonucleotidase
VKILLDMDGVLADFVGGISKAHGRPSPFDDPQHHGKYEMTEIWGMEVAEFWKPTDEEFWASLEPTSEATEIVRLATDAVGTENVCLLSSPCAHLGCVPGKLRWIERHFPQFKRRFLFGPRKEFCAAPNRLLIDDWDQNVAYFTAANGNAWLYPRPWNTQAAMSGQGIELLGYRLEGMLR